MRRASRIDYARDREGESAPFRRPGGSRSKSGTAKSHAIDPTILDRRASDARDRWLGRLVDQRYRVTEVIGRGGMGVVYKVEHQRMGKVAAMKVLHHELATDPEVVRRFQREAEAVSRLAHPNTVQVFDFGNSAGALYLVMEYIRGLDLGTLIDRDGPMSFERAAPLLAQVCAALGEAHDLGVIHRDLKPENILVTRTHGGQDFVKVLDFGLAKLSEREEAADVTGRGSIVGTPYYMSPEQIRGEDAVGPAADIYSFGALMYRILTGHHAFTAKSPVGVLTKHLTEPPQAPSTHVPDRIDGAIDDIVLRCLAKKPEDRYESVHQLLGVIEEAYSEHADASSAIRSLPTALLRPSGSGAPVVAAEIMARDVDYGIEQSKRLQRSDLESFERQMRRRRRFRVLIIPLLLAAAGAGAVWFFFLRPESAHTAEVEPNNTLASMTLIEPGTEVTGTLGKRIDANTADKDLFRLTEVPARDGTTTITAHVTALPNMDVVLRLHDHNGKLIAEVDEGGVGAGEWLRRHRLAAPPAILVTEADTEGLPTENVSDSYKLTVKLTPADSRLESEPNDTEIDANPLSPGSPVTGYLDHRGDTDVYRIEGEAGRYALLLSGGPQVPFAWRKTGGDWTSSARETLQLESGSYIEIRRDDGSKREKLGDQGDPYTLDLSPAN